MTVNQLIRKLREMPQDMQIAIEVIDSHNGKAVSGEDDFEIFEGMNYTREERVVIQAFTD